LNQLREQGVSLHDYSLGQSRQHHEALRAQPLDAATLQEYKAIVSDSVIEQQRLESSDTEDFSSYVARFHAALRRPVKQQS
jgi:glutamate--cysteine ligase